MPCMCGDSQCPSCGLAQGTLDPGYLVDEDKLPFGDHPDCPVCCASPCECAAIDADMERERAERDAAADALTYGREP